MDELLPALIDWMMSIPPLWAYGVILVVAYVENVLPPIPGDLIVVFGGYLVGLGTLDYTLVVVVSTLGGAVGFMTMYAIGVRIGEAVLDPNRYRWLPKPYIHKTRAWIRRWGYGVIAANRFLSGARSVISLTVGMAHMNAWKTAGLATVSALVWTALLAFAGYQVGENWEIVSHYLQRYGQVILLLIVLFLAFQIVRAVRLRRSPADEETGVDTEQGTG